MHFLYYEILKNFVGYDRSTDYSDSLPFEQPGPE